MRARTPTPRREKRIFCAGFLLSWGFEEDDRDRGHGHGGGGSSHPHGEALHGSKSGRGKARWCGAGGHRELQPSHLHAQACSIQSFQKMSCSSEGSRCWVDNGYMSPVNDGNKKKAMQKGYHSTLTILSRVKNSLCKDGLADQGSVKVMLLCGSDCSGHSANQGFGFQIRSKEEVEPEEVLRRITTACGRLVEGTRQARVCGGAWCGCRGREGAAARALSPGHWLSDPR